MMDANVPPRSFVYTRAFGFTTEHEAKSVINTFPPEAFYQLPFGQGDKNHNSTLAWSLWHLFRIEDVAAHTLILEENRKQYPEMNVQARFKIHGTRKIIACCNYGGLFSCCLK